MKKLVFDKKRGTKKPYTFRLYPNLMDKVKLIAEKNETTIVSVIEYAIEDLIQSLEKE